MSQPRLIQHPQSDAQELSSKFERMKTFLKDSGFDSVGKFLKILFYNPSRLSGESDPRGSCHAKAVSRFLQGQNKIKMSDIISLIYKHKHSTPLPASPLYSEHHASFSPSVSPGEIFHARPSLFSWATNLIADHVHHEIYALPAKDDLTHLRASTNGRHLDHACWISISCYLIDTVAQWFRAPAYIVGGCWFNSSPCRLSFPRSPRTGFQHGSSNRVLECVVSNRAAQGGRDSGLRGCVGYLLATILSTR